MKSCARVCFVSLVCARVADAAVKTPVDDDSLNFNLATAAASEEPHLKTVLPHSEMKAPDQVQHEVEQIMTRVDKLDDPEATEEFAAQLEGVETALAAQGSNDTRLMNEISVVRKDLCVEQGFAGHEDAACETFMHTACNSSSPINSTAKEVPAAVCQQFFLHSRSSTASAPAAAEAQPPGPAPAPAAAPAPPGLFGSKLRRPLMDQGFSGKLVEHKDSNTYAGDWQEEFGPGAHQRTAVEICKDFKDNEWCRLHGYYEHQHDHWWHNGAGSRKVGLAAVGVILVLCSYV